PLPVAFDESGTKVEAALKDGRLEGQYSRGTRGAPYPFQAKRFAPAPVGDAPIPPIAGLWNIQVGKSSKGEAAWQLIVRQSGAEASAAVLRVDRDTGTLTGTSRRGEVVLSESSRSHPPPPPPPRCGSCRTPTPRSPRSAPTRRAPGAFRNRAIRRVSPA